MASKNRRKKNDFCLGGMPYAVGLIDSTIEALFYNESIDALDYTYVGFGQQMTCVSLYATKIQ